jgi:APA family basic amino acid/polyamine antiporter
MDPLPRRLTLVDTTLLVVGGIIGTGIFFNSSNVAARVHTPGLILTAWLIGGAIALIGALSYAELGAMMPQVGGEYAFLREGWHPVVGFLYGWTLLLVISTGAIAAVTMKFAETLATLVPALQSPLKIKLTGLAALWGLAAVNYFGVKPGALVQNVFTTGKLVALACLIALGFSTHLPSHLTFHPFAAGGYEGSLFIAMGAAMAPILFSYGGWQNSTYTAGEIVNPQKTVPRASIVGILIVIVVYLAANIAYLHVLPADSIRHTTTLATDAAQRLMGDAGARFISIAIVVSTFGFIDMTMLTSPRVFYAMARDGLLFGAAAYIHPKYKTPTVVLGFYTAFTSVMMLAGSYDTLLSYATFGDWIFFGSTVAAVFTLRRKFPDLPRPYKAWGYPVLPALFVIVAFTFVVVNFIANQPQTSYGLVLILTGIPAYLFFRELNRRASEGRNNAAFVALVVVPALLGGVAAFLLRPLVEGVGRLPFGAVITAGANSTNALKAAAQQSFAYLLAGVILGGILGLACGILLKRPAPKRGT